MTQSDLFGHKSRRTAPDTQIEGLDRSREDLSERQEMIMCLIRQAGNNGVTLFEACSFYGVPPNQLSGRFTEIAEQGMIADSGKRRMNPKTGINGVV